MDLKRFFFEVRFLQRVIEFSSFVNSRRKFVVLFTFCGFFDQILSNLLKLGKIYNKKNVGVYFSV